MGDDSGDGFYIQWHFLDACNLRCKHCYQDDYSFITPDKENLGLVFGEISKAITTWKKNGRISLTGGEPFLEFDKLIYLLSLIDEDDAFYWSGILTNGTLIDSSKITALSKVKKLKEVQVSLDGSNAKTHDSVRGSGVFLKAIDGLNQLIDAGIPAAIMFTLTKKNIDCVVDVLRLASELGINAITVERYTTFDNSHYDDLKISSHDVEAVYEKIFSEKKILEASGSKLKIRTTRPLWHLVDDSLGGFCPVGYSSLCVMHDGEVYPCRRLPISIGNILTDGLFKIWYKSPVLWDIRRKNRMRSLCGRCADLGRCGGCRAAAFAESGDYMGHDPLCWK